MQFLCYSDIHHDDYQNGLTEDDVVYIEDQITQYAVQTGICHVIFNGDWFRATNPVRSVIAAAEASWQRRSAQGIHTHVVVGNHDRWTKAVSSGHAFVAAGTFLQDLSNVHVYDEAMMFHIDGVDFIAVPSGHEHAPQLQQLAVRTTNNIRIVLFHGLILGSALANGLAANSGINPDALKQLGAAYIIGGDNHTHQPLDNLLGCQSMYLGAPMQHNWGDRGQQRGFWHFVVEDDLVMTQHVPTTHPKFVRERIEVKNEMDAIMAITNLLNNALGSNDGIVEISLTGETASSINTSIIEQNLGHLRLRKFKLVVDRTYDKMAVSSGLASIEQPEDKWMHFISKDAVTKDMNPNTLAEMGKWAIQEARKII